MISIGWFVEVLMYVRLLFGYLFRSIFFVYKFKVMSKKSISAKFAVISIFKSVFLKILTLYFFSIFCLSRDY